MPIREAWAVVDNIKDGVVLKKPLSSSTSKQMANVINSFGNIAKQIDSKVDVKTLSKRINSKINNVAKKILSQWNKHFIKTVGFKYLIVFLYLIIMKLKLYLKEIILII